MKNNISWRVQVFKGILANIDAEAVKKAVYKNIIGMIEKYGEGTKCFSCSKTECPMLELANLVPKSELLETVATMTEAEIAEFKELDAKAEELHELQDKLKAMELEFNTRIASMWASIYTNHSLNPDAPYTINEDAGFTIVQNKLYKGEPEMHGNPEIHIIEAGSLEDVLEAIKGLEVDPGKIN